MKKLTVLTTLSVLATTAAIPLMALAAPQPVPCENMLKDVKAAAKDPKLDAVDKPTFADLQSKGIERCKADDDAGADALFAEALKLIGK